MEKYIISLDEGTTSTRALLIDKNGCIKAVAQREFSQIYPRQGWVEHDPLEIWSCQVGVMNDVLLKNRLSMKNVDCIGITNQRETTVIWDKNTGEPVYNAIVWQCRRTSSICQDLIEDNLSETIHKKTGLVIDAYFSGSKIKWILDMVPGVRERAEAGDLLFGTIDTWILWKLTGGKVHSTDISNASRTMLFNISEKKWDRELLDILSIPEEILPEVKPSSTLFGTTDPTLTGIEVPVTGIAGDQQSALFGQLCFREGDMKNTYGTGCFLLMNTGTKPVFSRKGLLTTIAWEIDGITEYALEGSVFMAGAVVQWLRDELGLIKTAAETENIAYSVEDTAGVYLVSAFQGLGTPYWDMDARGALLGLTRSATKNHIVRAALESIAYRTRDIAEVMEKESGIKIQSLKADGGAANNNFLLQFQSDILNTEVIRPGSVETTAMGAAFLAGLASGYWKDKQTLIDMKSEYESFLPRIAENRRKILYNGWKKAVRRSLKWEKDS